MGFNIIFRSPESSHSFKKVLQKPERLAVSTIKEHPSSKELFQSSLKKACHFSITMNL